MPKVSVLYGPPGTGKTTELLNRMASLKSRGVPASHIGFLAFTKAAAGEALGRLGMKQSKTIRTIHSLAYELIGCSREQVVDNGKLSEFAELVGYPITGRTHEQGPQELGDEYLELVQLAKAKMVPVEEVCATVGSCHDPAIVSMFAESYHAWKLTYGYLDFNDMIELACDTVLNLGLSYLFVDEAQDLSPLQWRFIEGLGAHVPQVTLAGDDDQAIYTWAGADPYGMRKFNGGKSKPEVLLQSHRIPSSVHTLAQDIITRIPDRVSKHYVPRQEVGSVASWHDLRYVSGYGGLPRKEDTLVLYRNHSARAEVEEWLTQMGAAYRATDGRSSWFEDRYANAVRTYYRLRAGEDVTTGQWDCLRKTARPDLAEDMRNKGDITWYLREPWNNLIIMPWEHEEYLRLQGTDGLFEEPTVRISTIHAAKGAQADRVILMNSRGARTYEEGNDHDEIRTWYVGVTRAKHTLDIVHGDNSFPMGV